MISIFVSIFLVLVFVFLCAASGEIKMFITLVARRHNVNVLLSNTTFLIFAVLVV